VEIFDPKDLRQMLMLDIDKKRLIVALEVDQKYIFFGCEGGSTFSFSMNTLERKGKSTTINPCTAGFCLGENLVIAG